MLVMVSVLDMAEALTLVLVAQVTEQPKGSVEDLYAPKASAAVVQEFESRATPPVGVGTMCNATSLIEE